MDRFLRFSQIELSFMERSAAYVGNNKGRLYRTNWFHSKYTLSWEKAFFLNFSTGSTVYFIKKLFCNICSVIDSEQCYQLNIVVQT